jgi:hypothetical protein
MQIRSLLCTLFYLNMYISLIMHMFDRIPTCLYTIDVRKKILVSVSLL